MLGQFQFVVNRPRLLDTDCDIMEAESLYCSGLTYEQFEDVAKKRQITAAVCFPISILMLLALVMLAIYKKLNPETNLKLCDTTVKHLAICLAIATAPYELFLVIHSYPESLSHDGCVFLGLMIQYFGSVQILLMLGISVVLFFKVWKSRCVDECPRSICIVIEVIGLVLALAVIFVLDLILLATNSYGASGPWCWIRNTEMDCTVYMPGQLMRIILWDVPFLLVMLTTVAFISAFVILLVRAFFKSKTSNKAEKGVFDFCVSFVFLGLIAVFCLVEVTLHFYLLFNKRDLNIFVAFSFLAIITPLGGVFIPVALLIVTLWPISSAIARPNRPTHQTQEQASAPSSSYVVVPSHTTYDCPHDVFPEELDDAHDANLLPQTATT